MLYSQQLALMRYRQFQAHLITLVFGMKKFSQATGKCARAFQEYSKIASSTRLYMEG